MLAIRPAMLYNEFVEVVARDFCFSGQTPVNLKISWRLRQAPGKTRLAGFCFEGDCSHERKNMREKPYLKDVYYIRGILKNRLGYLSEYVAADILEVAFLRGRNFEELKKIAIEARSWTDWRGRMEALNGETERK